MEANTRAPLYPRCKQQVDVIHAPPQNFLSPALIERGALEKETKGRALPSNPAGSFALRSVNCNSKIFSERKLRLFPTGQSRPLD